MKLRHLAVLLLALPFLLADSCVKQVFVLYEYELDQCPPRGFELPESVRFAGWQLHAGEGAPYCHAYTRYEFDEVKTAEVFSEPLKGGFVYVRLLFGSKCHLAVISNLSCNSRESIGDCERRMPYQGAFQNRRTTAKTYTELVAERIVIGQKFAPKFPAIKTAEIGRATALEEWCGKK